MNSYMSSDWGKLISKHDLFLEIQWDVDGLIIIFLILP